MRLKREREAILSRVNYAAESIHPLTLLNKTRTRVTGGRTARAIGREADNYECGTTEFADISELADGISLCVNRDTIRAMSGAETILTNRENLAAPEQNGDVNIIQFGLLGVAALVGIDVGVQCASDPRWKRKGGKLCCLWSGGCGHLIDYRGSKCDRVCVNFCWV